MPSNPNTPAPPEPPKASDVTRDLFNDIATREDSNRDGMPMRETIDFLQSQGYDWAKIRKFLGLP